MTHIDLFSGIGGFALAAQANGVTTKVFCEQNEKCCDFLARTYGLPIIRDVRKFDGKKWRGTWLLTAGVPCQPSSRAGKQKGEGDDRWLWHEAVRVTEESQPAWALFENPSGILDVGLDGILSELGRIGYESQPLSIPACAVNSPQDRERIWILSHRNGEGQKGSDVREIGSNRTQDGLFAERTQDILANGSGVRHKAKPSKGHARIEHTGSTSEAILANSESLSIGTGLCQDEQTEIGRRRLGDVLESWADSQWIACEKNKVRRFPNRLHRLDDGVSSRILEALGNAIVWPVAAEIIAAMIASEQTQNPT